MQESSDDGTKILIFELVNSKDEQQLCQKEADAQVSVDGGPDTFKGPTQGEGED